MFKRTTQEILTQRKEAIEGKNHVLMNSTQDYIKKELLQLNKERENFLSMKRADITLKKFPKSKFNSDTKENQPPCEELRSLKDFVKCEEFSELIDSLPIKNNYELKLNLSDIKEILQTLCKNFIICQINGDMYTVLLKSVFIIISKGVKYKFEIFEVALPIVLDFLSRFKYNEDQLRYSLHLICSVFNEFPDEVVRILRGMKMIPFFFKLLEEGIV